MRWPWRKRVESVKEQQQPHKWQLKPGVGLVYELGEWVCAGCGKRVAVGAYLEAKRAFRKNLLLAFDEQGCIPLSEAVPAAAVGKEVVPFWRRLVDLAEKVPDEEFAGRPTDMAEQHDHYVYGTPKRKASTKG